MSGLTEAEEARLQKRDDCTLAKLTNALDIAAEEIREARNTIEEKTEEIRRVREAVREGRWYELRSYLSEATIESLCDVSPVDLLGDYVPR